MDPKVIINYKAVLGEGPCWDENTKKLWWIDGLSEFGRGDDLHLYDPATGEDKMWHIGKHIGCAIPSNSGKVMLNLQDGIYLFDPKVLKSKHFLSISHIPIGFFVPFFVIGCISSILIL